MNNGYSPFGGTGANKSVSDFLKKTWGYFTRRARRREKLRRAGPQASNAGLTPETTLDVRMGSG